MSDTSSDSSSDDDNELASTIIAHWYFEKHDLSFQTKIPYHTSSLSGAAYVEEMLNGHEDQCYSQLRMSKDNFKKLANMLRENGLLKDSPRTRIEEQLAIFLYTIGHNVRNRCAQDRYQHSGETISRYFDKVLNAIIALREEFIQLPDHLSTHPHILQDPRFYPYFENCIGALDGTHIDAIVRKSDGARFRNRKHMTSQNVLGVVTFDLLFAYVGVGWEGSAHDSRVLKWALTKGGFSVPEGKFYLVDSGYSNTPSFLAPFRSDRYHLKYYRNIRSYRNFKDIYNHRHAQLRNVVERAFGILKARFPILKCMPPYSFEKQTKIVMACCIIHNYLRRQKIPDRLFQLLQNRERYTRQSQRNGAQNEQDGVAYFTSQEREIGEALRKSIAEALWTSYEETS